MLTISGYPRLHLGLIDCGTATRRRFGGLGFSINGLPTTVTACPARTGQDQPIVLGDSFDRLDRRGRADVAAAVERARGQFVVRATRLELECSAPEHSGLGSKTALILAVLHAIVSSSELPAPRSAMQRLSGRGGASGVGIWAFYRGGLIVDLGHARSDPAEPLRPSGAGAPRERPPMATRAAMPSRWQVSLILPDCDGMSGQAEVDFFARHTPIPPQEVERSLALAYHGILPAVIEQDLTAFACALREFQSVGFKSREVAAQPEPVLSALKQLAEVPGVAAGLSSMGPAVFAVHDSADRQAHGLIRTIAETVGLTVHGPFAMRNSGYARRPR